MTSLPLREWETRLRPYLAHIELLAEIPLSQAEHAELEKALSDFVQRHGLTEATRRLRHDYPATFVTYLAFKAAFNRERSFWDNVIKAIGLDGQMLHQQNHHWGKAFREIIEEHGLRRFRGVSGLEYITPIRLHGGISAYSLPDFFQHILMPSVKHTDYIGLDDIIALERLLERPAVEYFVDDPVRYFFEHGGESAQRFFQRCRQMARKAVEGEVLPSPRELGLRPYVCAAFENYLQNPPESSVRRRLPRLFFDPYQPSFRMLLPSQPVTFKQVEQIHEWKVRLVRTGDDPIYVRREVRVRRSGQEWLTDDIEWQIAEPAEYVQVHFIRQEETVFRHSLRLLPAADTPPLLAFREMDESLCSITPALPATTLWLFYPADVELQFDGKAHLVERLHPFSPPWDTWQAHLWDLSQVRLVRLMRNGEDVCLPVLVSAPYEPQLEGQYIHPQSHPVDEKPLFLGTPRLRLPIRNIQAVQDELRDWSLTLESRYAARPMGKWEGCAADLPCEIQSRGSVVLLGLLPWLREKPVGTYHLIARGPGRQQVELPFRTWPEIEVRDLQPYYLPTRDGAQEITFTINLCSGMRVVPLDERSARVQHSGEEWKITVLPEMTRADLWLEAPEKPEVVRVPLRLAVPRLRWAIQLDASAALEWKHHPPTFPLAELLQSHHPCLIIELPLGGEKRPLATLHLMVPDREMPLQSADTREFHRSQRRFEFSLGTFMDTLRGHKEHSVFYFVLEMLDGSRKRVAELLLLQLTQQLDIRVCYFQVLLGGRWCIHWYEPTPLRYRRLRLWPLWQPWAEPIEIRLPDDAEPSDSVSDAGWWMADVPPDVGIPPSWYKAQFVAVAPDDAISIPTKPPDDALAIEMITPYDRLRQIESDLRKHPRRAFAFHIEKTCIYASINRPQDVQREIQWCSSHWREANLLHLLALQRWLKSYDSSTQQAFLSYMFRPESVQKLNEYPPSFVQEYLAAFPQVKTAIIKTESARMILSMTDSPAVIAKALQVLLRVSAADGFQYLWNQLESGRFSEADAAQVLSVNPEFAFQELLQREDSPLRARLLIELTRQHPCPDLVVWKGYWVRSPAGWGKIITVDGTARQDAFFPNKEEPRLQVNLREGTQSEEMIFIDLHSSRIEFPGKQGLYICGCKHFMASAGSENEIIWRTHFRTCNQNDQILVRLPYSFEKPLVYSMKPPQNMFA